LTKNTVNAYDKNQTGKAIYGIIIIIKIIIITRNTQTISHYAVCLIVAAGGTCSVKTLGFGG
jgi:hypothetical protein